MLHKRKSIFFTEISLVYKCRVAQLLRCCSSFWHFLRAMGLIISTPCSKGTRSLLPVKQTGLQLSGAQLPAESSTSHSATTKDSHQVSRRDGPPWNSTKSSHDSQRDTRHGCLSGIRSEDAMGSRIWICQCFGSASCDPGYSISHWYTPLAPSLNLVLTIPKQKNNNAGSVSKVFAPLMLLQLRDKGLIDLDEEVRFTFPPSHLIPTILHRADL